MRGVYLGCNILTEFYMGVANLKLVIPLLLKDCSDGK